MLNGRKTIGVLIFDMTSSYQENICYALNKYGRQNGYNVLVFSACTIYGRDSSNARGEYNIIHLVPYEDLDGLIVCDDTFYNDNIVGDVWGLIKKRVSCPVVSLRRKVEGYYNVLVDDNLSISGIVRHFYEVHHYERIAFMSGPLHHPDAIRRLEDYKRTMAELGLSYPEEYIFDGDFWTEKGKEAAEYFSSLTNPPRAIVCANDYMALSLSRELVFLGYMIPDDFAISGFDDIQEAGANLPPLTTCAVSVDELGKRTIDMFRRLFGGEKIEPCEYVPANPIIRNSCGCLTSDINSVIILRMQKTDQYNKLLSKSIHNTFTSIELENLQNVEDIGDYLQLEKNPDQTLDFYLCLGDDGEGKHPKVRIKAPGFAEYSKSVYSLKSLEKIETSRFSTRELLPPEAVRDEPMCIFFFTIHYLEYNFGYVAATQRTHGNSDPIFHSWLSNIGSKLENVRMRHESEQLLEKLNTLYIQDTLTKLYNRRGFEQLSEEAFCELDENHNKAMVLSVDMDNLKTVNDTYGHAHGDIALKAIAAALQNASRGGEICARVGGDEFSVYGSGYDEKMAEQFLDSFYGYLDTFNKDSKLEYQVTASSGYSIARYEENQTLEYYIRLSDDRLYKDKKQRKKKYGDLSLRHEEKEYQ